MTLLREEPHLIDVADTRVSARTTAVVALVALVVYLPSLSNGFAFDDVRDVIDNPAVSEATGPLQVLSSPYRGDVPTVRSPYRPVTSLSYWLDRKAAGDTPLPFHLVNVVLHVLAAALVVRLLGALGASGRGALLGGLIFAVHPVHVEAVANVVGRAEVLMTIFCLAGALAFLDRRRGDATRAALVALAYALALGSKEDGVALPLMLAVTLLLPSVGARSAVDRPVGDEAEGDDSRGPLAGEDRGHGPVATEHASVRLRRELRVLAPTLLVLDLYLMARESILGALVHRDTAPYIVALPASERVTTAVADLTHFARLLLAPADLVADYGPDVVQVVGPASVHFWAGVLVAVLTVVLAWALVARRNLGAVAVAWCVLPFLVVSNLFIPIGVWLAERTLYLPSVGIAIGVAALVGYAGRLGPRGTRAASTLATVLVLAGAWRTVDRIPSWRDTDAVLATLADEHPESFRSQWWLARRLTEVGDLDGGLRWYQRARETNPNDLGLALDEVRVLLVAERPEEAGEIANALPPTDPARFVYLAQSRIMTGRSDEAAVVVRNGLERFPADERLRGQARDLGLRPLPRKP